MEIRQAFINEAKKIKEVYLQAFGDQEADLVSELAVKLLVEKSKINTISLVAVKDNEIVGHVAFSPVLHESSNKHCGYILSPLAVIPNHQGNKIGSTLVQYGLEMISNLGSFIVLVYGDPKYYSRFGFETDTAGYFIPPYTLQYPEGWQVLNLNSDVMSEAGRILCVDPLNDSKLW